MLCMRLACTSMKPVILSSHLQSTFIRIPTLSCLSGFMSHLLSANVASLVCHWCYKLFVLFSIHNLSGGQIDREIICLCSYANAFMFSFDNKSKCPWSESSHIFTLYSNTHNCFYCCIF